MKYDFVDGITPTTVEGFYDFILESPYIEDPFDTVVRYKSWNCFDMLWLLLTAQRDENNCWGNVARMILSGRVDIMEMILQSFEGTREDNIREMGYYMCMYTDCDYDNIMPIIEHYGLDQLDPDRKLLKSAMAAKSYPEKLVKYLLDKGYTLQN